MEPGRRDLWRTAIWTAVALVAADVALGLAFRPPADPRVRPSPMAQYLQFGASIESKFHRAVPPGDSIASPVARAGWLRPFNDGAAPLEAAPGRRLVAVYGQSFTFQIAERLPKLDSAIVLRTRGGPASPASHGYALWQEDRGRARSDVAVLGVLASSVRGLDAASAATWEFESPPPYTYPRYRVDAAGRPVASELPVRSLADLRAALADPARMRAWERELARDDDWYDPFLWKASWLDHSTIARLLRRAWAQREQRRHLARLHDRHGFREDSPNARELRALVASFVAGCRADGTAPVVLLVEDAGYSDDLARLLGPELDGLGATWLATHGIVDASRPENLRPGGHFVPEMNERLAAALLARIQAALAARGETAATALPGRRSGGPPGGATGAK